MDVVLDVALEAWTSLWRLGRRFGGFDTALDVAFTLHWRRGLVLDVAPGAGDPGWCCSCLLLLSFFELGGQISGSGEVLRRLVMILMLQDLALALGAPGG